MTKEIFDSAAMRRTLIRRFTLAMIVICSTTTFSFIAVFSHLRKNERDAHLINISGRQRMLSQRIAFLALDSESTVDKRFDKMSLVNCIKTMEVAHQELSRDSVDSLLRRPLFKDGDGLDRRVQDYLGAARALMDGSATDAERESLHTMATRGDFLDLLDQVVAAYELEYDEKIARFKATEIALLLVLLGTVALLSWFVFRPTVELVSSNLRSLERSNAELTEFSYRISHDLRSPVVSALGIVEVTKNAMNVGDDAAVKEGIDHVHTSLSRVSETIEDIVTLVKQKMTEVPTETFILQDLIQECIETIGNLPDFNKVTLQVDCDASLEVRTKRVYLKQTIENLLSNAVKYRDPEKEDAQVTLSATVEDGTCHVAVDDNGLGIDSQYRDRLFSMFQRFHPEVSVGTGLGLYLVKQNAKALDGEVTYRPRAKGSTFEMTFPALGA